MAPRGANEHLARDPNELSQPPTLVLDLALRSVGDPNVICSSIRAKLEHQAALSPSAYLSP